MAANGVRYAAFIYKSLQECLNVENGCACKTRPLLEIQAPHSQECVRPRGARLVAVQMGINAQAGNVNGMFLLSRGSQVRVLPGLLIISQIPLKNATGRRLPHFGCG